jgi:hypothetical protein
MLFKRTIRHSKSVITRNWHLLLFLIMDESRIDLTTREAAHELEVLIFGWILLFAWLGSIICMTREFFMDRQHDELDEKLLVTKL